MGRSSLTGQARIRFNTADVTQALTLYERALKLFETAGLKSFAIDALMSARFSSSAVMICGVSIGCLRSLVQREGELGNA